MNIVAASHLEKTYIEGRVEVTAVSDVTVTLRKGELVGLFGPSGSGKTTLLSVLGCILRPTSGSIKIFDREVSGMSEKDLSAVRREYISFIFQGFNLFPALTSLENVKLILKLKGISPAEADERARDLLKEVSLDHRLHFLPRDLSGGQKQRVAIARALAADAPIVFADEPTGNLDHVNGKVVMELLKELSARKGTCIVVATHDNRTESFFDRLIHMEDGRITSERSRI